MAQTLIRTEIEKFYFFDIKTIGRFGIEFLKISLELISTILELTRSSSEERARYARC